MRCQGSVFGSKFFYFVTCTILRFHSGVTPVDLLTVIIASEPI